VKLLGHPDGAHAALADFLASVKVLALFLAALPEDQTRVGSS
jgi:hypothetical protein